MTNSSPSGPQTASTRSKALIPLDLIRGFLIGSAELVPGVSGGTIALVTGVYDQLIDSAAHVVSAAKTLITGPKRVSGALSELRRTDWFLVIPVLLGMATAVFSIAGVMESFVTSNPELARGLFFGLVAASIAVPLRMLPARTARQPVLIGILAFLAAAALAFWMTSMAGGADIADPPLIAVFFVASIAVCALVIPGVSGSFFLLAVGMYSTTLRAVDERNLGYLGIFMLGAILGLALFVNILKYFLHNHRWWTLLVMAGLMFGSLRALWPWQSEGETGADGEAHGAGSLLAPVDPIGGPILLAVLGAAVVVVLIIVEARFSTPKADTAES
jgi:putative membrane protein